MHVGHYWDFSRIDTYDLLQLVNLTKCVGIPDDSPVVKDASDVHLLHMFHEQEGPVLVAAENPVDFS